MLSRSLSLSFCHFSNSLVTDMGWTAACSNASSCLMNPNHLVLNFSGSSQAGTDLSLIALVTNQCSQHSDCPSSVDYVSISAHQLHYLISWFSSSNSGQQAGLRNTTCVLLNLCSFKRLPSLLHIFLCETIVTITPTSGLVQGLGWGVESLLKSICNHSRLVIATVHLQRQPGGAYRAHSSARHGVNAKCLFTINFIILIIVGGLILKTEKKSHLK